MHHTILHTHRLTFPIGFINKIGKRSRPVKEQSGRGREQGPPAQGPGQSGGKFARTRALTEVGGWAARKALGEGGGDRPQRRLEFIHIYIYICIQMYMNNHNHRDDI